MINKYCSEKDAYIYSIMSDGISFTARLEKAKMDRIFYPLNSKREEFINPKDKKILKIVTKVANDKITKNPFPNKARSDNSIEFSDKDYNYIESIIRS